MLNKFMTIFFFFISCSSQPLTREEVFNKIISRMNEDLSKDKLFLFGIGFAGVDQADSELIDYLTLTYDYKGSATKEEAKKILIKSAKKIIKSFSDDKDIFSFIDHPPFTDEHLFLNILFNPISKEGEIDKITYFNKKITYKIQTENTIKTIFSEPYDL